MAYSEELDSMIRAIVAKDEMIRKKMFGGTCYMHKGKMLCGVWKNNLILKVGEEKANEALKSGKAKVFDITGKAMRGWIMFDESRVTVDFLESWISAAKERADEAEA